MFMPATQCLLRFTLSAAYVGDS